MRLIVSKAGSVLRTQASGSSSRGERGETEGLVRHLVAQGHDVTYFGIVYGELPCRVVEPCLHGVDGAPLTPESDPSDQQYCWNTDAANVCSLAGDHFDCYLQVAGPTASAFSIASPSNCRVTQSAVRYLAPQKGLAHHLRVPVWLVNNDPRTYPREQEQALTWTDLLPVALLDNWTGEREQTIGWVPYRRRSVHAWTESWGHFEPLENVEKYSAVVVAQAHIDTGVKQPGRVAGWTTVLCSALKELPDLHVYGYGWSALGSTFKAFSERFHDGVDGLTARWLYSQACASPCVGYSENRSGKAYMIVASGCLPLLYGDGRDPHTWDREGDVIPLNHPCRVVSPLDVKLLATPEIRREWIGYFQSRLKPNWSVLDAALSDWEAGLYVRDRTEWHHRYGGYEKA